MSDVNSVHISRCIEYMKVEITFLYKEEYESSEIVGRKPASHGLYDRIHEAIKIKRNLPANFTFPYNSAKKRIARNTVMDLQVTSCPSETVRVL
jgi:hypothetical protein